MPAAALLVVLMLTACQPEGGLTLASIYKGGDTHPAFKFLSDHAFFVRRNRIIPAAIFRYPSSANSSSQPTTQPPPQLYANEVNRLRAILLPAEDEALLTSFAETFGTGDHERRRRLFIGVIVRHSTKRFTGPRFLRLLELLDTNYLDLLLVSGRPCGHSQRDRLACGRNRLTPAFLHNWRNLMRLAKKRRILNLGLRHYPLPAVRQLHQLSTPECLDYPSRSVCSLWQKLNSSRRRQQTDKNDGKSKNKKKTTGKKHKKKKKAQKQQTTTSEKAVDLNSAYALRRAAGNVNFLTVAYAAFNPHHRHRVLRRWCHRHSVVLLADEALGGPHESELLADQRLKDAAAAARLPIRTAVLHWALKKRTAVAVGPSEAAEFAGRLGSLAGIARHLVAIDRTVPNDVETRYYLVPVRGGGKAHPTSAAGFEHNEL